MSFLRSRAEMHLSDDLSAHLDHWFGLGGELEDVSEGKQQLTLSTCTSPTGFPSWATMEPGFSFAIKNSLPSPLLVSRISSVLGRLAAPSLSVASQECVLEGSARVRNSSARRCQTMTYHPAYSDLKVAVHGRRLTR